MKHYWKLGLVVLGIFFMFGPRAAHAAAPTGSSGVIKNDVTGRVVFELTGANFSTFIHSGTATADSSDLASISYGGFSPASASIASSTILRAEFLISNIGTGKSGGSFVIGGHTIKDTGVTPNTTITIVNGSITDQATPLLSTVSIASDNTDTTFAIPGDVVTLSFTGTEALASISVSFASGGDAAAGLVSVASTSNDEKQWAVSYTVTSGDTDGAVTFSLDFEDAVGNNVSPTTTVTDASSVTVDANGPILTTVSITSDNADTSMAKETDTVTLSFTGDEALASVSVNFTSGGDAVNGAVTVASTSDDELNWEASYTVDSGDTDGAVAFTIDFEDAFGNDVSPTTTVTDASSVTVDMTNPSTPVASPAASTYSGTQSVTLTSAGSTSIRYTTNGTDPATCAGGSLYTGAITVSSSKTIKARGCDDAGNISGLGTFSYIILGGGGGGGSGSGFFMPIPAASPAPSPLPPPLPPQAADAANLARFGLHEGDTISADGSTDPDIFIVNAWGYKRLFLNPIIFGFYGHLGGFTAVKHIPPVGRDVFPTSGLFRNCETGDLKVYALEVTGEDVGFLHWVNVTGNQAALEDPNFFKKVFCINTNEFSWYPKSPTPYTTLSQLPAYNR